MKLLKLLWGRSPPLVSLSVLSSLLTAALMLVLLTLLSHYLSGERVGLPSWWQFSLVAVATTVLQVMANVFISYLTQKTVQEIRGGLVRRIIAAPLSSVERLEPAALISSLENDASRIADSLPGAIALLRDLTFMVACFAYLGWLSYKPLLVIFAVIAVGALIHQPLQSRGMKHLNALRGKEQQLSAVLKNLVDGLKQLKLSVARRESIVSSVDDTQTTISRLNTSSLLSFAVANAYAVLLFLGLIVFLVFGGFQDLAERRVLLAYTLTLVFLLGPLQTISNVSQQLSRAGVALDRIRGLEADLRTATTEEPFDASSVVPRVTSDAATWQRITLDSVSYRFDSVERQQFSVGPLDLSLRRGEVLFIIGGNGSGKTTFGKIVSGLYMPFSGTVKLDDMVVTDVNRDWYRQQFGAVFSDFCLFDGLANTEFDERVGAEMELVSQLRLDHVIDPKRGLFAQAASFSSGEKRRVAMLLACLDDKPAYVFDEFAADQDPDCRDLFYHRIVPHLKKQGKLIVVITHDTRYFECADCMVTFERGMPAQVSRPVRPVTVAQ